MLRLVDKVRTPENRPGRYSPVVHRLTETIAVTDASTELVTGRPRDAIAIAVERVMYGPCTATSCELSCELTCEHGSRLSSLHGC